MTSPGYSQQFAYDVLTRLGVPKALQARDAGYLHAWNRAETAASQTAFSYNPWATTRPSRDASGAITSHGGGAQGNIQIFPTYDAGVTASAATLAQPDMAAIVAALKAPDQTLTGFADAVALHSAWNGRSTAYRDLIANTRTTLYSGDTGAGGPPPAVVAPTQLRNGQSAVSAATAGNPGAAAAEVCRFPVSVPTSAVTSWDFCADPFIGGLAILGGALILAAGVALVTAAVLKGTGAGRAAATVADAVPTPTPRAPRAPHAPRPAAPAAAPRPRAPRPAPSRPAPPPDEVAARRRANSARALESMSRKGPGPTREASGAPF